jgi:hypothetical protein
LLHPLDEILELVESRAELADFRFELFVLFEKTSLFVGDLSCRFEPESCAGKAGRCLRYGATTSWIIPQKL